jgi:hypothetical protein
MAGKAKRSEDLLKGGTLVVGHPWEKVATHFGRMAGSKPVEGLEIAAILLEIER